MAKTSILTYINFSDDIVVSINSQWKIIDFGDDWAVFRDTTNQSVERAEVAVDMGEQHWYMIQNNDNPGLYLKNTRTGYDYTTIEEAGKWYLPHTNENSIDVPSDGTLVVERIQTYVLYRFDLERYKVVDHLLVPYNYDSSWMYPPASYVPWFDKDLEKVAESIDSSTTRMRLALISNVPMDRFWVYYDIGRYHGFDNFDSLPITITEYALDSRWNR